MIWLSQNGGPWGTGPRGGGPWGGGSGPRGGGPRPPNLEEILRRGQDRFRHLFPGGFSTGTGLAVLAAAILAIWLISGFYRVLPDQVGIVLRFGAYDRTTGPGLNYHLPAPIETVETPSVTSVHRTEIGYRTGVGSSGRVLPNTDVPQESLMLTGDENIVDVNFTVFWLIKDAKAYLFNIKAPGNTVKSAAESAMREVIGENPLAMELSEGRAKIEADTKDLLQGLLDQYGAGIRITQVQLQRVDPPGPVIAAFRDVQAALADQARLRNEALAYRNDILPKARGQAVAIVQAAEAYRQQAVARAEGDAARFNSVYNAFKLAKDVTLQRLYIETLQDVLEHSNKVVIDQSMLGKQGVLPYLPLPGLPGFGVGGAGEKPAPRGGSAGASPSGSGSAPAGAEAPAAASASTGEQ